MDMDNSKGWFIKTEFDVGANVFITGFDLRQAILIIAHEISNYI